MAMANKIWQGKAQRWARIIGLLPFVRRIYLTGSVASGRATTQSDIDLLIVAGVNRLWITRALVVGVLKLFNQYGGTGKFCPHYWVADGYQPTNPRQDFSMTKLLYRRRTHFLEWLLSGSWGDQLERKLKHWQISKITNCGQKIWPSEQIKISDKEIYFHPKSGKIKL